MPCNAKVDKYNIRVLAFRTIKDVLRFDVAVHLPEGNDLISLISEGARPIELAHDTRYTNDLMMMQVLNRAQDRSYCPACVNLCEPPLADDAIK